MNEEHELLKLKMEQLKLNIEYNYVFVMPYVNIDNSYFTLNSPLNYNNYIILI